MADVPAAAPAAKSPVDSLTVSRLLGGRSISAKYTSVTLPSAGVAGPRVLAQSPMSASRVAVPTTRTVTQSTAVLQGGPSFIAAPPQMVTTNGTAAPQRVVVQGGAPVPTTVQVKAASTATSAATAPGVMVVRPGVMGRPVGMQGITPQYVQALEARIAAMEIDQAKKTHSAFVFIKPHAVNEKVKQLVKENFQRLGIYIISEGEIPAEEIDRNSLIDTHYGAIAAKAVSMSPSELVVQQGAQNEFQKAFGLTWEEALQQNKVYNAMEGAKALGISTQELGAKWGTLQKGSTLLKFGGGFYCGKIDDMFVINGFYMDMRAKFTNPGTCIYYFETEWDARMLTWADFRGKVLGGTDPATAAEGSVRNLIYQNWYSLELASVPDTGDNGVHASASPFEALAERANWLNMAIETDNFGKAMIASSIPAATIEEWCKDPAVTFEGKKQSLFDLLEDLDARDCLRKASQIVAENGSS